MFLLKKPYFALDKFMYGTYINIYTDREFDETVVYFYMTFEVKMSVGSSASLCISICRKSIIITEKDFYLSVLFSGYKEIFVYSVNEM